MQTESHTPSTTTCRATHDPLRILRAVLAGPGRFVRPWYLAYLLLGVVTAGLVPVLFPLIVSDRAHSVAAVAYVMGVYNLGLLTSPLWGLLAERWRLYRSLFFLAFVLGAAALAIFPLMQHMPGWLAAAFVLGAGSAGAGTLASLFVVDFAPQEEWEPRIGMLQGFNGTGQVVGLLLAGLFAHGQFDAGLWICAILLAVAVGVGGIGLPGTHAGTSVADRVHRLLDVRALAAFPRINLLSGPAWHFSHFNLHGLRHAGGMFGTPFGRFLLSWFMLALGVAGFFTYFPILLARGYGLNTHASSLLYAAGAGVGIALFVLASRACARYGSARVYQWGLAVRIVGFVLLLASTALPAHLRLSASAVGFLLIVMAWPVLSVAGTGLAAHLATFSEGAAMGLFNASLALATVIGAFASGPLIGAFGYPAILWMGVAGIGLASVLGAGLGKKRD